MAIRQSDRNPTSHLERQQLPTLADFDSFLAGKFEKTLGALISDLKNYIPIDPALQGTLTTALKKRNWLAHNYFRERAETFMSDRGCATMIAELESAQELFDQADRALEAVVKPLAAKVGVTDDQLDALVTELTLKARTDG